jgi:hypothetical protein
LLPRSTDRFSLSRPTPNAVDRVHTLTEDEWICIDKRLDDAAA